MRVRRVAALTLGSVLAACAAQVAAPRSAAPTAVSSAALSAVPDAVYVRESANGTPAYLTRIDVRSGMTQGALPDGIVSADRSTLYWIESVDGATRTRVHEIDVATGDERRAFTIDGDWLAPSSNDGPFGVSADGRRLVLSRRAAQVDGRWVGGFAVLDVRSGTVTASADLTGPMTSVVTAVAPHGEDVVVTEMAPGRVRMRVWDAAAHAFLTDTAAGPAAWDGAQLGFVGGPRSSADGRRLYFLDAGDANAGPFLRVVDLGTKRLSQLALPPAQRTINGDYEKLLLWTLALSRDGSTAYAANAALGYVAEIDAHTLALRRAAQLAVSAVDPGPLARVHRAFLPVAEAKRYIRGGALVSSDGRRLYVPGTRGIDVIDVATLRLAAVWAKDGAFDGMALSPDGARLYGIDDQTGQIEVIRTSDGAPLGAFRTQQYAMDIPVVERADASRILAPAPPAPCGSYAPPDPGAPAEIQHLKTSATVVRVVSPCAIEARIAGGYGTLAKFSDRDVVLRATGGTTFASASAGDLDAIRKMGLKAGETFTLSFDGRAFPDGSYPLTFMNR